jgi:hypothetical protein
MLVASIISTSRLVDFLYPLYLSRLVHRPIYGSAQFVVQELFIHNIFEIFRPQSYRTI